MRSRSAVPLTAADSCDGDGTDWDGDFEKSAADFVAVVPDLEPADAALALVDALERVRRLLKHGTIKSVTLLFRDGLSIEMSRWDAIRLWRGESSLLQKETNDD